MRVLFISPFVSRTSGHAAADLSDLTTRLAEKVDLTVFKPTTQVRASPLRHIGLSPASMRKDWPRRCTEAAVRHIRQHPYDLVHVEYLQPAEVLRQIRVPTTLALHDVSHAVASRLAATETGVRRAYRTIEAARITNYEKRALRSAKTIVSLSEADAAVIRPLSKAQVVVARPGVNIPEDGWKPRKGGEAPCFVFMGALWRPANVKAVHFLLERVMPGIQNVLPRSTLSIVGSRPSRDLAERVRSAPGVTLHADVLNVDDHLRGASVVLAPTVVGGGVLLKLLRSMALGCPTVSSGLAARGAGAAHGLQTLVAEDAEEFVQAAVMLAENQALAVQLGREARRLIAEQFTWRGMVSQYLVAFEQSLEACGP